MTGKTRLDDFDYEILPDMPKNRKYFFDERAFQFVDSPETAYWLGFLMADGGVSRNCLSLNLGGKDKEHLKKFQGFLGSNHNIYYRPKKEKTNESYGITVCSKKLITDLSQYGIISQKTGKEQIKNIPHEFIRDWILGFFDGDGSISLVKGSPVFSLASSSIGLLEHIQRILMEQCDLNRTKLGKVGQQKTRVLSYGGRKSVRRIYEFLYEQGLCSMYHLARKRDKFLD